MLPFPFLKTDLFGTGETVFIAATQRLADHLHHRHGLWQQAHGHAAWDSLPCYTLNTLLDALFTQAEDENALNGKTSPMLLSQAEWGWLWRQQAPDQNHHWAALAAQAADTLQHYALPDFVAETDDQACFQKLNAEILPAGWITRSRHWAGLAAGTPNSTATPFFTRAVLAGFDHLPPSVLTWLQGQERLGAQIYQWQGEVQANSVVERCATDTPQQELEQAALWAKQHLQAGQTLALVVPDLSQRRAALLRTLADTLGHPRDKAPANVSLGLPLSDYPSIQTALLTLRVAHQPLSLEDWDTWLRSDVFDTSQDPAFRESDWLERCRFSLALIDHGAERFDLKAALNHARHQSFHRVVGRLEQLAEDWDSRLAPPSAWSKRFDTLLKNQGWPYGSEASLAQAWLTLLEQFSQWDRLGQPLKAKAALNLLQSLCDQTIYQPESEQSRLQVLGPLEMAGLSFDAIWVLGLDSEHWPPPLKPNPLLPLDVQRQHHCPRADGLTEYARHAELTERLRVSAQSVVFSHVRQHNDLPCPPSALIKDLPLRPLLAVASDPTPATERKPSDDALAGYPAGPLKGGVRWLADQALCPFRALAFHRLAAPPLEPPVWGYRPLDRGNVIHETLQNFWLETQSQGQLLALSLEDCRERLGRHLHTSLKRCQRLKPKLRALEHARLLDLLMQWLEKERIREPFTVEKTERSLGLTLGAFSLSVRLDRLDKVQIGAEAEPQAEPRQHTVIIDYKTGSDVANPWQDERPEAPQLLVYSLVKNIGGLAFAHIHPKTLKFSGVTQYGEWMNAKSPPWEPENWQKRLRALAEEIHQGHHHLQPKKADLCQACAALSLCRRHEYLP